jgi:CrcB protein
VSLQLAVALGAVRGAPARYLLDRAVLRRVGSRLPWGILAVNLLGCAAAGLLVGVTSSELLLTLVGVGFLGSFTTASTLAWDVLVLGRRSLRSAGLLLALHVGPGVVLAGLGLVAGRALAGTP